MLHKALYGIRKDSRLWQRFLRDVLAGADWKASVIFASMYTLGDQRGTLGCWDDDLLVEADEVDVDAVEAHRMKRLEGEGAGTDRWKELRRGWVPEASVAVRRRDRDLLLVQRHVQDAAATLELTGRSHECKTADTPGTKGTGATLRDGDQKLDENETAAFRSALGPVMYVALDRSEILDVIKTVAPFISDGVGDGQAQAIGALLCWGSFSRAEWVYSRQGAPKCLDVYGDSDWAGDEERKRSTTGVKEIFGGHPLDAASATQSLVPLSSAEAEFCACNRGTAGGLQTCHFLDRGGLRGDSVSVERQQCLAAGSSAGQTQAGSRHLEIRHLWTPERLQKGEFLLKAVPTDDNVADLMTKHLAAARVGELLTKPGVRRCARGLVVASLIARVEANHFDARADHVATVSLAHEVMLLVVGWLQRSNRVDR